MPALRYAYFPGCVAKGSAREVEDAMRAVVKALGIELVEMPGAACCARRCPSPLVCVRAHACVYMYMCVLFTCCAVDPTANLHYHAPFAEAAEGGQD